MLKTEADNTAPSLVRRIEQIGIGRQLRMLTTIVPLAVLAASTVWEWGMPGLYMDAINPEYLARWVLHGDDGTRLVLPGNAVFGRFPVFTGSAYHGSTQLYFALPFFVVFGINLASWRVVQFAVAGIILALLQTITRSAARGRWGVLAAMFGATALAIDPGFVLALRTQAYSCIFPVGLLLGAMVVLRVGDALGQSARRMLAAGIMIGLASFSYFIFFLFVPAFLLIIWISIGQTSIQIRLRAYRWFGAGMIVGYLPFVFGVLLMARDLGGFAPAVDYLRNVSESLHVRPYQVGLVEQIEATFRTLRWTINGEWVSETVVNMGGGTAGSIRAAAGVTVIVAGVLASFWAGVNEACRRLLWSAVALLVSFTAGAAVLGDRLQGHHFAALLPVWYLSVALSLVLVGQSARLLSRHGHRPGTGMIYAAVSGSLIAACGVASQAEQRDDVRETGGVGLYSEAITALGVSLEREADGAAVMTPDWGFHLPLQFLAGGNATVLAEAVDPGTIRAQACRLGVVIVVSSYPSALDYVGLAAQSMTELESAELWRQDDGTPLFEVATFVGALDC